MIIFLYSIAYTMLAIFAVYVMVDIVFRRIEKHDEIMAVQRVKRLSKVLDAAIKCLRDNFPEVIKTIEKGRAKNGDDANQGS